MHPLTYLNIKKNTNSICSNENCKNEINCEEYFYFCSSCEYYLCEKCKLEEKNGKAFQLLCLWHEHPLNFCFPLRGGSAFVCDHCGKLYEMYLSFYCTICDYDLCYLCYKKYTDEFKNKDVRFEKNKILTENVPEKYEFQIKTNHKHGLTKCLTCLGWNNKKYYKCHICEEPFGKTDVIYLCSLCDFKYCIKCVEKIKVN